MLSVTTSTTAAAMPCSAFSVSSKLKHPLELEKQTANASLQNLNDPKARIRNMFDKVELSVSSYDTAWVAMIPSPNSPDSPFFPECSKWILDNQRTDGSWGLPLRNPLLVKDALSSTLACILALKRWGVGEQQINNGLKFLDLNSNALTDEKQHTPVGFEIIFPGMIEQAKDMSLKLPLNSMSVDAMVQRRNLEFQSINASNTDGRKAYLAYVSEGMGKLQDWEMVMRYQRKNGSILNSPSATAAAFSQLHDAKCLRYLSSLLDKFGNAVPTIYPLGLYARLWMVDNLKQLGVDRHFQEEIKDVLDETYRCWLLGEEELFLDEATCGMAFRLLRSTGYVVSSDALSQFTHDHFVNSLGGFLNDPYAVLELYKASEMVYPNETATEEQLSWTNHFLKQELLTISHNGHKLAADIKTEVHDTLNFPFYLDLDRLANRRSIEHYVADNTRTLKTSYRCMNIGNREFLRFAADDFNICQSLQREEFKKLNKWVFESRLDKLKFARQKQGYCYFSAATTLFAPELSDARSAWAKNGVLTTVVDDFFDVGGSEEEQENFIGLIEEWDVDGSKEFCSEQVEIIFSAVQSTICEIGEKALKWQGRDVTNHVVKIWLDLIKSMRTESRWTSSQFVPTLDEYMTNAYVSFALGPIVLPSLYLVGPKLSKEMVNAPEYYNLFKTMSTCGRLLNDWRGFQRESKEGKLNAVTLKFLHGDGAGSEEEVINKMKDVIRSERRKLHKLVLEEKDSVIPRACRDLFWNMIKVLNMFYMNDDGFTSNDIISIANSVLNDHVSVSSS